MSIEQGPEHGFNPWPSPLETQTALDSSRRLLIAHAQNELQGATGQIQRIVEYNGEKINVRFGHITYCQYIGDALVFRETEYEAPDDRGEFLLHETHGFRFKIDFKKLTSDNSRGILLGIITEEGDVFAQVHQRQRSIADPLWLESDKKDERAQVDRETGRAISQLAMYFVDGSTPLRLATNEAENRARLLALEVRESFLKADASRDRMPKIIGRELAKCLAGQFFVGVPSIGQVNAKYSLSDEQELRIALRPNLEQAFMSVPFDHPDIDLELVDSPVEGVRNFRRLSLTSDGKTENRNGQYTSRGVIKNSNGTSIEESYAAFLTAFSDPNRELVSG